MSVKTSREGAKAPPVRGRIVTSLGGFYYVAVEDEDARQLCCRARGLFRRQGITPLTGDWVLAAPEGDGTGTVEQVLPRRNSLARPPVANLDALVLVASIQSPPPNLLVLDKLIAAAEHQGIEPVLAVTKTDLDDDGQAQHLCGIYRQAGLAVYAVSALTREGTAGLREGLRGKVSCFCGNTGAGKSSLLNALDPRLGLQTGEISQRLGRGRHTTRQVTLYPLEGGGWIADTPGFSAVDLTKGEVIRRDEVAGCFREFAPYVGECRYTGCSHTCEDGCAVLEAVRQGQIAESRLESYRTLMEDAKKLKEWELTGR